MQYADPKRAKTINALPPRLVVAVESPAHDWTRNAKTGFQVAQFTFAAQAGHPVYLDVLRQVQQVTRRVDRLRRAGNSDGGDGMAWDSDEFVFYWTGPTVWSQAVWRYLRARWGFDVARLTDVDHPVRVGDVLILPYASFQADYSEMWVQQSNEILVWHGAHHRWTHKDEHKDEQKDEQKEEQMEEPMEKPEDGDNRDGKQEDRAKDKVGNGKGENTDESRDGQQQSANNDRQPDPPPNEQGLRREDLRTR
jgi:hypothetical protein